MLLLIDRKWNDFKTTIQSEKEGEMQLHKYNRDKWNVY